MDVSRGSQLTTRQIVIAAAGVLIFAFSLYANTLSNGFVWDDRALIVENPRLADHSPAALADLFTSHFWDGSKDKGSLYRPLVMVTYHLNYGLFGSDARGARYTAHGSSPCEGHDTST